jgi:hypothetical protein
MLFKVKSIAGTAFRKTDVKASVNPIYKRPVYKSVFESNSQKSNVTLLADYLDTRPVAYYIYIHGPLHYFLPVYILQSVKQHSEFHGLDLHHFLIL